MTKDLDDEKSKLNNKESTINRGFELMLRHHNRREQKPRPRTFGIMFGKVVSLLKREFHFHFEISFSITKK